MSDLQKIGSDWGGAGTFKPLTAGISGGQRVNDAHGRFVDAVLAGRVYQLAVAAAAPTAYVGAAGGTPLLAVHNPAGSNRVGLLYVVSFAQRAAATAAAVAGLLAWSGASAAPTGTKTTPTNVLTQQSAGSGLLGFVNAALTGSTALSFAKALMTLSTGAAAAAAMAAGFVDIGGILPVYPGNQLAIGLSAVPTSVTCDVSMFWEEIPLLAQV